MRELRRELHHLRFPKLGFATPGALEGHFELFWALVAKWLSDGLSIILSSSGLQWPNGSQMAYGRSF